MSERDGFQNGVPCWVDTWQPDADAAMSFYTQLFGWEAEDTMPDGVEGTHYMCRLRGRDVAAIASRPDGAPPTSRPGRPTSGSTTSTRPPQGSRRRRQGPGRAVRRPRRRPDRGDRRSRRRRDRRLAAGDAQRSSARQRAKCLRDELSDDERPRRLETLLRRRLRLGYGNLRDGRERNGAVAGAGLRRRRAGAAGPARRRRDDASSRVRTATGRRRTGTSTSGSPTSTRQRPRSRSSAARSSLPRTTSRAPACGRASSWTRRGPRSR